MPKLSDISFDMDLCHLYTICGYNEFQIAKILGKSRSHIQKRVNILGIWVKYESPVPPDDKLRYWYLEKEYGARKISNLCEASPSAIYNRLKKIGIIDSSRKTSPSGLPSKVRRPAQYEFKVGVKRLRFSQEKGICQECGKKIESWKKANYHHIKLVSQGGDGSAKNCMVLHHECHLDPIIFEKLHKFPLKEFTSKVLPRTREGLPVKITDEEIIEEFVNKRRSVIKIAEERNILVAPLYRRIHRMMERGQIDPSLIRKKTLEDEVLIRLHKEGLSGAEIGRRYSLTTANICQRLIRLRKNGKVK